MEGCKGMYFVDRDKIEEELSIVITGCDTTFKQ